MLIRNAEIEGQRLGDVRIEGAHISAVGTSLPAVAGEEVLDANRAALFPGLHDHHIHLAAYAASLNSLLCGPPDIENRDVLAAALAQRDRENTDWLRGIGYHECVAGEIDRRFLDRVISHRPVRIQHRSGRLWIFNSAALAALHARDGDPFERDQNGFTGRLYDGDAWLRDRLKSQFPDLTHASRTLAAWGVTGVTDATASNTAETLDIFQRAFKNGELLQSILVMGDDSLNGLAKVGPRKFHLHDEALPDLDETVGAIMRAHAAGRSCAFHCVTRGDLIFALAALESASPRNGDRIEHASVASPELIETMRRLGVAVVTQPHFVFERGDRYLTDVGEEDRPWLYPAASFAGLPLAFGTDAPFGGANPWAVLKAAVARKTRAGRVIGRGERLTPEQALKLFLGRLEDPGGPRRRVMAGEVADLVLLDRNWHDAQADLASVRASATLRAGQLIFPT